MKYAIMVVLAMTLGVMAFGQAGTLQRAEKLTETEKKALSDAQEKVASAQQELQHTRAIIAVAHGMGESHWMEYSSWYEFDGDFILQRYLSYQVSTSPSVFTEDGSLVAR